jgi:hypothetical protein
MKKLFVAILFMASVVIAANAQPKIQFKTTEHDFGQIKEDGGPAVTMFDFTNEGNAPLVLSNVKASCGCTTPEWPKEPIAPGKTGTIKVSYDPQNRPNSFRKTITVSSNADQPNLTLTIMGNVIPREKTVEEIYPREMGTLRFKTNYVSFGDVKNSGTASSTVEYINTSDKEVKIGLLRAPAFLTAKFQPEVLKAGEAGVLTLVFDATKKEGFGHMSDRIYLSIDGSDNNNNSIGVSASIVEDFSSLTPEQLAAAPVANFEEKVFDFDTIKEGESVKHSFKLTNTGKSDLLIRDIKTTCGCTTAQNPGIVKAGASTSIDVTFNSRGKRGRQNKAITVISNDPQNSTIILRLVGNIAEGN